MNKSLFSLVLMLTTSISFAQSITTDSARQKIRNVVEDHILPRPTSASVGVEIQRLQDLRRDLMKTRSMLDRGMIDGACRWLGESVRAVDEILASPVI